MAPQQQKMFVRLLLLLIMAALVNLKPLSSEDERMRSKSLSGDHHDHGIKGDIEDGAMTEKRRTRHAPVIPRRRGSKKGKKKVKDFFHINKDICPPPLAHLCTIQVPGPDGSMQSAFVTPFFEGDIILDALARRQQGLANMRAAELRSRPRRPSRQRRAIVRGRDQRWPDAIVPYTIDDDFNSETAKLIKSAMRHWQRNTCIKFVPKEASHVDYLRFTYYPGCWSFIGRQGGEQLVSMGPGCNVFGTIVHEIGHAIGYWHEQSRRDRDDYITVINKNLAPGTEENFGIVDEANVTSRGYPYDFASVMHYSSTAFSANGKATIRVKKKYHTLMPDLRLGDHSMGISDLDIAQTRGLYRCNERDAARQKKKPCTESEAGDGREYRGELDFTQAGVTCQRWTSQYPHEHNYFNEDEEKNVKRGIGDHNFCRNPSGRRERPWCFTTLTKKVWDYCDIKICPPPK